MNSFCVGGAVSTFAFLGDGGAVGGGQLFAALFLLRASLTVFGSSFESLGGSLKAPFRIAA